MWGRLWGRWVPERQALGAALVDAKYLEKRGSVWWVTVYVPRALRPKLGRKLTRTLATDSLNTAQKLRWQHVANFKAQIEKAAAVDGEAVKVTKAHELRDWLAATRHYGNARSDEGEALTPLDEAEATLDILTEEIAEKEGPEAAARFFGQATGQITSIGEYIDRWLAASHFTERTKGEHRTAIKRLEEWAHKVGRSETLEGFTGQDASAYRDLELIAARGLATKTINKAMSSLRVYWRWLLESELVKGSNPWVSKSLGKRRATLTSLERPFTNDEVRKLLTEIKDRDLQEFMRIAALSGMRIQEIASLTVGSCGGGAFRVRDSKTEAGVGRVIPIHSNLVDMVAKLCEGRSKSDFLLLGGLKAGRDGDRSMAISKRFTRYRRRIGVDDTKAGQRRSLVNFHSFRRWFIKEAISGAGQGDPWTIADIVGHKAGELPFDLTMRQYPGASEIEKRRKVVDSVCLPTCPKL